MQYRRCFHWVVEPEKSESALATRLGRAEDGTPPGGGEFTLVTNSALAVSAWTAPGGSGAFVGPDDAHFAVLSPDGLSGAGVGLCPLFRERKGSAVKLQRGLGHEVVLQSDQSLSSLYPALLRTSCNMPPCRPWPPATDNTVAVQGSCCCTRPVLPYLFNSPVYKFVVALDVDGLD